ncbi:MAG: hypothetical protein AB7L41_14390 [Flavobacteriaceae bacterium]
MRSTFAGTAETTLDQGEPVARTHPGVFIPAIAVAVIYGGLWALLHHGFGRGDSGFARLSFLIAAVVPPVLLLIAYLRYSNGRIRRVDTDLVIEPDWPGLAALRVAQPMVGEVTVERSWLSRFADVGTLHIALRDGATLSVRDCAEPERIARAIQPR